MEHCLATGLSTCFCDVWEQCKDAMLGKYWMTNCARMFHAMPSYTLPLYVAACSNNMLGRWHILNSKPNSSQGCSYHPFQFSSFSRLAWSFFTTKGWLGAAGSAHGAHRGFFAGAAPNGNGC